MLAWVCRIVLVLRVFCVLSTGQRGQFILFFGIKTGGRYWEARFRLYLQNVLGFEII